MLSEAHTLYSPGDYAVSAEKVAASTLLLKLLRQALKAIKRQRNEILSGYACMRKMTNDSFKEEKLFSFQY